VGSRTTRRWRAMSRGAVWHGLVYGTRCRGEPGRRVQRRAAAV